VLEDLAAHPDSTSSEVRKRLQKPLTTVDRELRALHCIGLVECEEEPRTDKAGRQIGTVWRYRLPAEIDPHSSLPEIYVPPHPQEGQHASTYISGSEDNDDHGSTYISGACPACKTPYRDDKSDECGWCHEPRATEREDVAA
jgi:hypothetical protein